MSGLGSRFGELEGLRRLGEAYPLEIAQADGLTIPIGKPFHGSVEPFQPLHLFDSCQRRWPAITGVDLRTFVQRHGGPARPKEHADFVHGDGTEPTPEIATGAQLIAVDE